MNKITTTLTLFNSNINDMFYTAGFKSLFLKILGWIFFFIPALLFTVFIIRLDGRIKKSGIHKGFDFLLKTYYNGVETYNYNIPDKSGVLLVSNHPGICDTAAIISILKRSDVKIVVIDKPFFHSLHNLQPYLIPIPKNKTGVRNAILSIISHLENGGIVLLYPAGLIEPDPEFSNNGEFLKEWNTLTGYICMKATRKNLDFKISPIVVRNIFSKKSRDNPFVKMKKDKEAREQSASLFIAVTKETKNQKIKIDFKKTIDSSLLVKQFENETGITQAVRNAMRQN